jgi:replicative DNA helicase
MSGGAADLGNGRMRVGAADSLTGQAVPTQASIIDGARFALDVPQQVAALWGEGSKVLWALEEPLMIVGPDGVGKTTIAQQLMLARMGIRDPGLLGLAVEPETERKVLYLAMDRPRQAARSMRRMASDADRELLTQRLAVWRGALPFDVVRDPDRLLSFALEYNAGTVVIDSLKDLAPSLSDEVTGQAINHAMQVCVAAGVETLPLHHQRKAQGDNKKPKTLADVYGSRWLTAGCGSVVMLWGEAGDPIVEFAHLKQPDDVVGPLTLLHDNRTGLTTVAHSFGVVELLKANPLPMATRDIAIGLLKKSKPSENEIVKVRRQLKAAEKEGRVKQLDIEEGEAALWQYTGGLTRGVDRG